MPEQLKSVEEMAFAVRDSFTEQDCYFNLDDIHLVLLKAKELGFLPTGPSNDKFVI